MDDWHEDSASFVSSLPGYSEVLVEEEPQTTVGTFEPEGTEPLSTLPRYSVLIPSARSPRYTTIFGEPEPPPPSNARQPRTKHNFSLKSGKKPWATLTISSHASSSANIPRFYGGDDIAGSVSLNLNSTRYIQAITLLVKGQIITSYLEEGAYTFLDKSVILWTRSMGDPRQSGLQPGAKGSDGRLTGQHQWPFSFPFPTDVNLSNGPGDSQTYQLPQTFTEKNANVTIQYHLILHINRGKLRADQKINTPVIYIPKIVPGPPSAMRQLAYRENSSLLGPLSDADGWFTLPTTVVCGELPQNRRNVQLRSTLSIANPLCYTRGTVIPCSITIRSVDSQILDLLASPDIVRVNLQRHIKYFQEGARRAARWDSNVAPDIEVTNVAAAVWWSPPQDPLLGRDERRAEGEIHLPRDLHPTSDFALFTIEYFVNLLPFQSLFFTPPDPEEVLVSQAVTIGTFAAQGPTPNAYTIRRHSIARPQVPDFNTSSIRHSHSVVM